MQFRIYDRQTLAYKDGGYVASYTINDDYIANNNSTIKIVKELNDRVIEGDTIALIETSGAYHKGIITTLDNADLSITYKSERELFNDNMLNPYLQRYAEEEGLKIAGGFDIDFVGDILQLNFGNSADWAKAIPLKIITDGEITKQVYENGEITQKPIQMAWNWSNASINITDWLINLFERYNLSVNWSIDFNIANTIWAEMENGKYKEENGRLVIHNERQPYYVVTLSAIINSGKIIKDNVANQTITYTEKELPEATICVIIDKDTKEIVKMSSGKNLFNPANITKDTIINYNSTYGTTTETASAGTSVSGFIKVNPEKTYTLSFTGYDNLARNIICYDKDKKVKGIISSYQVGGDNRKYTIISNLNSVINYIRINYSNSSTDIQLEEGSNLTAYDAYDIPAIYYLINVSGVDMVTLDGENRNRVFPVKTKIIEYDTEGEDTTEEQVAQENLVPSRFNQAIEIKISKESKMFDFENLLYGDLFKIINKQGIINSNYTGRKEESGNKWITLFFGLGRQNYTDLIQMRFRKSKYQMLYNKR